MLVADAQLLYADALAVALARHTDLEVLREHPTTGHEVVAAIAAGRPHTALVDYRLPGMDPHALVRAVSVQAPDTKVVHLAWSHDPDDVERSLAAGAAGFLPKTVRVETVAEAVRRAHAGAHPLVVEEGSTIVAMAPPAPQTVPDATARLASLTVRQLQILRLLAAGLAVRQIAEELGITVGTVRTHVHQILTRTGTQPQLEAVTLARRAGFLP